MRMPASRLEGAQCAICMERLFLNLDDLDEVMPVATADCGECLVYVLGCRVRESAVPLRSRLCPAMLVTCLGHRCAPASQRDPLSL
jgi:hypothetical protein